MNDEGMKLVKKEVCYPEFSFAAGQRDISVRRLEAIRRMHPNRKEVKVTQTSTFQKPSKEHNQQLKQVHSDQILDISAEIASELKQLEPVAESEEVSNAELVEQFTVLAQAIDWSSIGSDVTAREMLTSIEETLSFIADLAHESRFSPVV